MMFSFLNKNFAWYVFKFIIIFCFSYFGALAYIGLSVPGGYYIPFLDKHLNAIDWLRSSLLNSAKYFLNIVGYNTYLADKYTLVSNNIYSIRMVYSCLGYGVASFWAALIIANNGSFIKKVIWLTGGLISICLINILRICLLIVALNKHWQMPLGLGQHTLFNILAYLLIFILIYYYDRSKKQFTITQASQKIIK